MIRLPSLLMVCALLPAAISAAPPKNPLEPASSLDQPPSKKGSREAQSLATRGLTAFRNGDLDAARKDLEKALDLAPDNAAVLINLGLIAHRQRKLPEAEKVLSRAVRLAPEAGAAWLVLGIVRYDAKKMDAALAALAHAVWLEPKDARAHHYLGATLGSKGWYSGAEEEMRKAIELDPEYADAHFNLALLYLQRTPPAVELARRHYHKAVEFGASPDPEVEKSFSTTTTSE